MSSVPTSLQTEVKLKKLPSALLIVSVKSNYALLAKFFGEPDEQTTVLLGEL